MLVLVSMPMVVVLVTACSAGDSSRHAAGPSSVSGGNETHREADGPSSPVVPPPARKGTNRRLAMAEAAHVIEHFPVPPGSTRIDAPPRHARHLDRLRVFNLPVDQSLTRTRFWLVPLRYDRLVAWYAANTAANPDTASHHAGGRPVPEAQVYWQTHTTSKAFSPPSEVVAYVRLGPHLTAIRTDVTLAARADRTARTLVPSHVTSIQVTKRAVDGSDTTPTTVTVSDQARIVPVITAVNQDLGDYVSTESFGCASPVGTVYRYAVTFHWPGHALAVDYGEPLCGIGRTLTLDGTKLPPKLADSGDLSKALETAFEHT
jgi:hypothetical protein